jgi:hypothetical protein
MNASRQSFPVSAVICVLMAALFVARYRLAPYPVEAPFEGGMPLAVALTRFSVAHAGWAAALGAVVVLWTLLVVVQLSVKYAPASSRNYLPPQIFIITAGALAISGEALAALFAALLLTLATRRFVSSFHKGYDFPEVFHAGFYLGLIPLLYAPAVVPVVAIAIAALVIYRRTFREGVVCLAGLFFPLPAAGFIHWALGDGGGFIYRELWQCTLAPRPVAGQMPEWAATVAGLTGVLVVSLALVGIIWVAGHKKSIRKTPQKFIGYTSVVLLLLAGSAVVPGTSTTLCALVAVPCAVSVPHAFAPGVSRLSTVIYCLILAAILALHLPPVLGVSAL